MMMSHAIALAISATLVAQQPSEPSGSPLLEDAEIQAAVRRVVTSGGAQGALLRHHIGLILETVEIPDEKRFKTGLLRVLEHHASRKKPLPDLYELVLQAPVARQIAGIREAAQYVTVDGNRQDWPGEIIMEFPSGRGTLKGFGALRGDGRLFVTFETYKSINPLDPAQPYFGIEVRKLSSRFSQTEYTLLFQGEAARLLNAEGEQLPDNPDHPVVMRYGDKVLEVSIPLDRLEVDLRSIVVRGMLVDPRNDTGFRHTPFLSCPTGPVSGPLQMLIDLAAERPLPRNNGLPLAVALQEGLLMQHSHPDLAERIRKEALAWYDFALDLDSRMDLNNLQPLSKLPMGAQLAWACRFDGSTLLESKTEYRFSVPSPDTIASMRRYARGQGWWAAGKAVDPVVLQEQLGQWIGGFSVYDWPNDDARSQGEAFTDPRDDAYLVLGDKRYLSYRDAGINRQWKLVEGGLDMKGTPAQRSIILRTMCLALGQPTVWMAQAVGPQTEHYALSYASKRKKWFPTAAPASGLDKTSIFVGWGRPWTRPERFGLPMARAGELPFGPAARVLFDGVVEEMTHKRLTSLVSKGIPNARIEKSFLSPG